MTPADKARPKLTGQQWLICGTAALGFAFAIYMYLMLPLIVGPATQELLNAPPGSPEANRWVGLMFWVPALAGGVFGLLGGYMIDLLGRRTVLVGSILLYGLSAVAGSFVTSMEGLLIARSGMFVGVAVEFVAAITWLSELFPDPKQREAAIGYTQVAQSLGGLFVAGTYATAVTLGHNLPMIQGGHEAWRYTLLSGFMPVIAILVLAPFLPESPVWRQKKAAGTLRRPSILELFKPEYRQTTIVVTIMMACAFGAASGAIQQMPRIVPGLPELQGMARTDVQQTVSLVQSFQEVGGIVGRFLLAVLAVRIVSRRSLIRVFQIPGMFLLPLVFAYGGTTSLGFVQWGIFLVAMCTISQLSFWGNYLPRVFPTHLRGTGEGFCANVGGRMLGNMVVAVTTGIVASMPGATPPHKLAYAAATVGTVLYIISFTASFFLPEPKHEELPE